MQINAVNKEIGKCKQIKIKVTILKTLKSLSQRKQKVSVKNTQFLRKLVETLPRPWDIP